MAQRTIEYTADDNTVALKALKSRKDCNGDFIPNAKREAAIRILHRMPAAGELTYDFDNTNGWNATLYAQSAIVEAVMDRKRAERKATAPKPTSNRGPKALADMFRF